MKSKEQKGPQGPQVRIISKSQMPPSLGRGRHSEAMIITMPFWLDLVEKLKEGLNRSEAAIVDFGEPLIVDGKEILMVGDKKVEKKQLAARIRYQFSKAGFNKKYTLLVPGTGGSLFVVDNETAAMTQ
jgi:hypothetical protein